MPGKSVQAKPNPSASVAFPVPCCGCRGRCRKKLSFVPAWLWCRRNPEIHCLEDVPVTLRRAEGGGKSSLTGIEGKEVEAEAKPRDCTVPAVPSTRGGSVGIRDLRARHPGSLLSTRSRSCRVCPGGSLASLPSGKAQPCPSASCQLLTPKAGGANPLSSVIHGASKLMARVRDWIRPWVIPNCCSRWRS